MNCFSPCPRFFAKNAPFMLFCKALEQNEEWNISLRWFSLVWEYALILFSSFLGIYQGHQTTECFRMRQRCLKWFSFCFRSLFGLFGAGQKTTYLFGCLRGTLDNVCKVLQGFPSHLKLLATLIGPKLNFEDMEQLYFH